MPTKRLSNSFTGISRFWKRVIVLCVDIILSVLTVLFAFYLRLGEWVSINSSYWNVWLALALAVAISIPIFIVSGFYRNIFRYAGLPVLMSLVISISIYGVIYAFVFTVIGFNGVPRTIGLMQPILLLFVVCISRIMASFLLGGAYASGSRSKKITRALIYGAGSTGRQLSNALVNHSHIKVIGFLEDDNQLVGNSLNGVKIYASNELYKLIDKYEISEVLLALPRISRMRRNEIIAYIQSFKTHVRTLPSFTDLAKGRISFADIRELDVEDLLGRDSVPPDASLLRKNILDKVVLVTGAGGSIGGELCRQILSQNPKKLILLEQGEFNLYRIHQELIERIAKSNAQNIDLIPVLASVRDEATVRKVFSEYLPNTVYHAAAYKHVPLVEDNLFEGIANNVFGTMVMAKASYEHGVQSFTLISTDKAVRPTNIMGASKRLAEMVLQAISDGQSISGNELTFSPSKTIFSMVRFGNVLDSSGSVVPKFKEQISNGGPLTLTHPEVTRYFMTIPEAAQLVIQASALATGGEVFLLNMGNPIKIYDLAKRMIELSGLTISDQQNPNGDIEILVTGLRPGEKLYEELLIGDDPQETSHPKIMKAHENFLHLDELDKKLEILLLQCSQQNRASTIALLQELVEGYSPDIKIHSAVD